MYRGSHDLWVNKFGKHGGQLSWRENLIYESNAFQFIRAWGFRPSELHLFKEDTAVGQKYYRIKHRVIKPKIRIESVSFTLFEHLTLKGQGIYTRILENSDDAMQFPEMFWMRRLPMLIFRSMAISIFRRALMHTGSRATTHRLWRYFAPGSMPQKRYLAPSFPVVDIFQCATATRASSWNTITRWCSFSSWRQRANSVLSGNPKTSLTGFDWSFLIDKTGWQIYPGPWTSYGSTLD